MDFASNMQAAGQRIDVDSGMMAEILSFVSNFSKDGMPDMVEAGELLQYSNDVRCLAMQMLGVYVWPTYELEFELDRHIDYKHKTIEIGSGNGVLAKEMEIVATDSFMQSDKFKPANELERQMHAQAMLAFKQSQIPAVIYGQNVKQFEASEAVKHFEPDTVLGLYITHKWNPSLPNGNALGVDEEFILANVERYIMVGSLRTHAQKPILTKKHRQLELPGLICRSFAPELNRIFIWEGQKG